MTDINSPEAADWKRDSIWEYRGVVVSIVVFILGCALTWYIYGRQQQIKALSYGVVSSGPVASLKSTLGDRIKVTFDDAPIRDLRLTVVRVTNSGNIPITKQDFEKPIRMRLGKKPIALLLDVGVSQTIPADLDALVTIKRGNNGYWQSGTQTGPMMGDSDRIVIQPSLLNPGDSITFRVLHKGGDAEIDASARIVGVPALTKTDFAVPEEPGTYTLPPIFTAIMAMLLIVQVSTAIWMVLRTRRRERVRKRVPGVRL